MDRFKVRVSYRRSVGVAFGIISLLTSGIAVGLADSASVLPVYRFAYIDQCRDIDNYIDTANDALNGVHSASGYIDSQLARMRAATQTALLLNAIVRCVSHAEDRALADPNSVTDETVQSILSVDFEGLEARFAMIYYAISLQEHTKGFTGIIPKKAHAALAVQISETKENADRLEGMTNDPAQQVRASLMRQQLDSWSILYHF